MEGSKLGFQVWIIATYLSDDSTAYESLPFDHETVKHSLSEYVRGDVHTNGIESLWSMLKRTHKGTFHMGSKSSSDTRTREQIREDLIKRFGGC